MENKMIETAKLQVGKGEIVYLPLTEIYPHPENPRRDVGDVAELAESIKAKGVLQNLTVVAGHYENGSRELLPGGYTVIIGHRRRAGAMEAGLEAVPCAVVDMDYRDQVATLLENMQRVDLTAFEQAQGFQMMLELGDTVEGIAEKTGFSKKTVKHRLEMGRLSSKMLQEVSVRQISIGDFEKLERIKSIKTRNEVLKEIGTYNFDNRVEKAVKDELIAERMPTFVEKVRAMGAKPLNENDRYSAKYERIADVYVTDADADKPLIPKKYQKDPLFYYERTYWGDLEIYRKKPKEAAVRRPKEEIERERDMDERKKRLKAMTERHRVLRGNFVKGLVMHSKNRDKVIAGAISALACGVTSYMYGQGARSVLEFIGKKTSNEYGKDQETFREALRDETSFVIPAMIYLYLENNENEKYYQEVYNGYPKHVTNEWLDKLYEWLVSLGYEMSDEEMALKDGSHEVFAVPSKE